MLYENRMNKINSSIESFKNKLISKETLRDKLENDKNALIKENQDKLELIDMYDSAEIILNNISDDTKKYAKKFLEQLVTKALRFATGQEYSFEIEMASNNKCNFYVLENIDGEISRQPPEDNCGGGFVDIVSTTLRYAFIRLFNRPTLNGPIILDEPAKMVSEAMSNEFANFIKTLGEQFNKQTIIITHNANIAGVNDNLIEIFK